jgi:DNA-binding CsgD family transcriptional regulator
LAVWGSSLASDRDELPSAEAVQQIYRLIHHWCEIGTDTYAWRASQMEELCRLLDAHLSTSYVMRFSLDPADIGPKMLVYCDRGLNDVWRAYLAKGDLSGDPVTPHIMRRFGTDFTSARQDCVDDETWYGSSYFKEVVRASNWDQPIYSQVAITDPSVVDGFSLGRLLGKPAFTPQEIGTVRFMHQELARLWRRPDPVGVHTLPARQREVLDGIRRGEPRKAIAGRMGVSVHTVHTYEKALFERAGVKSRGELLARLAKLVRPNLLP